MLPANFPGYVTIVQGQDKILFIDLFYADTGEPYDLTGATEIIAAFPGANGLAVEERLTGSATVGVVGAPGSGKVQVTCPSADTAIMNAVGSAASPLPAQLQDLQVNVTKSGKLDIFILPAILNIVPNSYLVT